MIVTETINLMYATNQAYFIVGEYLGSVAVACLLKSYSNNISLRRNLGAKIA